MLTEKQFNALTGILENGGKNMPDAGQVTELEKAGFLDKGSVTSKGLEALQPYRVKKAVFLAAGTGSRLKPVSINTPKPLVRVNGIRIIDTLLDAAVRAGINEIIIVRGYLAEQFDVLKKKYPSVTFIDNPLYNSENNISSAVLVKDLIDNAYILEADLVLHNPDLIKPYQYRSNYLGVYTPKTSDWCFETDNGKITKMKLGGENCHHMFGISYWTKEDGQKLGQDLYDMYLSPGGKTKFWDFAALEFNLKNYSIHVRECGFADIAEIDSFEELKAIDSSYR